MVLAVRKGVLLLAAVALILVPAAQATSLLVNGGFETGDLTGWTVVDLAGGTGTFLIDDADGTVPISGSPTVGPASGNFYAVSDQDGPGTHALIQAFSVAAGSPVHLSFDMFVNDWSGAGPIVDPLGLDHTVPSNQHSRVDILSAAASPFDTGAGVLANFYLGVDPLASNPNPYTSYWFDITGIVGGGGTFQLRFAEVDNRFFHNQGVDNVNVEVVPEPQTFLLLGSGLLAILGFSRYRRKRV